MVAKGGIEPPTQGFSVFSQLIVVYPFSYLIKPLQCLPFSTFRSIPVSIRQDLGRVSLSWSGIRAGPALKLCKLDCIAFLTDRHPDARLHAAAGLYLIRCGRPIID